MVLRTPIVTTTTTQGTTCAVLAHPRRNALCGGMSASSPQRIRYSGQLGAAGSASVGATCPRPAPAWLSDTRSPSSPERCFARRLMLRSAARPPTRPPGTGGQDSTLYVVVINPCPDPTTYTVEAKWGRNGAGRPPNPAGRAAPEEPGGPAQRPCDEEGHCSLVEAPHPGPAGEEGAGLRKRFAREAMQGSFTPAASAAARGSAMDKPLPWPVQVGPRLLHPLHPPIRLPRRYPSVDVSSVVKGTGGAPGAAYWHVALDWRGDHVASRRLPKAAIQ